MIKKIIALICALSILVIPCNISFAKEDDTTAERAAILTGIGVYNSKITKYEGLVTALAGFMFDDPSEIGNAEEIAKYAGFITAADKFTGGTTVSCSDALKYAVITLGYNDIVKANGGDYTAYLNKASELGLTDGLGNVSADRKATSDQLTTLIWNMLEAKPIQKFYDGKYVSYQKADGTNLLELNRNIYKTQGLVTASEHVSIYGTTGTEDSSKIMLGNSIYMIEDESFIDLIGLNVEAYTRKNRGDEFATILYMYEHGTKNHVLELDADSIEEVSDDFSKITYWNENDKEKEVKLAGALRVVYNGKYYADYTASDLNPDIGSLRLIDNDGNGTYEIVFVTAYQTMVVDSVDADNYTLSNKYGFNGCLKTFKADDQSDVIKVYDGTGAEVRFSTIKSGNVVSVAASKGTEDRVIKIYISGKPDISGKVTGMKESDDIIKLDGTSYKQSEEFKSYLKETSKTIELGKEYTFSFDTFGNIAYMKQVAESDYVIVQKLYKDDFKEEAHIVYMDMLGEWHNALFAARVTVNDSGKLNPIAAYGKIAFTEPEVMKLKLNSNGEVTSIKTPTPNVIDEDGFTKVPAASYVYRTQTRSLNVSTYFTSDAKIIQIPADANDRDEYQVRFVSGYLQGDSYYTLSVYDKSEFGVTPLVTMKKTEASIKNDMSSILMLVTGKGETVSGEEVLPTVEGYRGVYEEINFPGAESGIFDDIEIGDLIQFTLNSKGQIRYKQLVTPKNTTTDYHNSSGLILRGTIEGMDTEAQMFKLKHGDNVGTFRLTPTQTVLFYNQDRNTVTSKTAASLVKGDEIVARFDRGVIKEVICYE